MLNQNKYFRKFLDKKETGSLLVGAAIVSAVVGTIMVGVFSSGLIALKQSSYQVDESEFHLLNQKGLSLASYLISNNVILCRKEGWSTKNKKCVWGGKYHDPKLVQSQFKISNDGYDAANKYYIKVTIAPETITTVYFDLANWEEDDNWSSLVGSVDDDSLAADDDKDMVVLTTITEGKNSEGNTISLKKVGGIRRPIGTPEIIVNKDVNSGQCLSFCFTADSENPFPECRGAGEFDKDTFQRLNIKVTNLGPGAIYRLGYEKNTIHSDDYFSDSEKNRLDKKDRFEIMGHDDVDVFMPGEMFEITDTLACAKPVVNSTTRNIVQTGNQAGTTVETQETIFYDKFSTYFYDLTASADVEVKEPGQSLRNNETYSIIEPRKLGSLHVPTELSVNKEFKNVVTIITTTVVDPCANGGCGGDGDGDGGGDGDGCN